MDRQVLTNDSGKWFDRDKALRWDESTRWDGSNHISCATGSQWNHEELYRTASGRWILHTWSQWQGSSSSWEEIAHQAAVLWLSQHGHDDALTPEENVGLEI